MPEYIEREAALSAVDCGNLHKGIVDALQENIKDIPSADVVEVGTYCPRCHFATNMKTFKTCPNCGAKMTEV